MKRDRRSLDSYARTATGEHADKAQAATVQAWRALALAAAPRAPKGEREKSIASAALAHDQARASLAWARWRFSDVTGRLKRAEDREQNIPLADRPYASGRPDPTDRATVTRFRPFLEELAYDLGRLGDCLKRYRSGETRRTGNAEYDTASRIGPLFISDPPRPSRPCDWCGKMERAFEIHYGLDGAGYPVPRENACRFSCSSCFRDGMDLADPSPKPLPVVTQAEHIDVAVEGPRALPPTPKLLAAGGAVR